ncbi:MAG: NUDIX hydrolase [Bacteroidota bacterium]
MDKTPQWQRSRSEYGPDLKLFRARFDWMINPRNGHEEKMILLEGGDAVQIVAETEDEHILLIKQYRFGLQEYIYELPGGLIDAGETPAEAAPRELVEETGYAAQEWQLLGSNPANPVFMEAHIYHFAAKGLTQTGAVALDAGEDIHWELRPRAEVQSMLLNGAFRHPHTVCGLLAYFADSFRN